MLRCDAKARERRGATGLSDAGRIREGTEMDIDYGDTVLRLGAATAAGIAIGLNRDLQGKPMGMRTLALVSLGAAAVTLSALQIDVLGSNPDALSRVVQGVIQGIMAGISFIGAGAVLRDYKSQSVTGLTTAATVWVAAALGIACGLGAWVVAGLSTAIALFVLVAVGWLERLGVRPDDDQKNK
jgi:putative Mg2+ transporter-C (MgtC) family protein